MSTYDDGLGIALIVGVLVGTVSSFCIDVPRAKQKEPEWSCECVEIEATSNDDLGTIKQTCMQRLCTRGSP